MQLTDALATIPPGQFRIVGLDNVEGLYYTLGDHSDLQQAREIVSQLETMEFSLGIRTIEHFIYNDKKEIAS